MWRGGQSNEEALLASCYRRSLHLAHENAAASVAFPAISTGAFGFPIARAARIAVSTVRETLQSELENTTLREIFHVCFSPADGEQYARALTAS